MEFTIQKERIHLFSPSVHVWAIATIDGEVQESALQAAVHAAACSHPILCSRVELRSDGTASFVLQDSAPQIDVKPYDIGLTDAIKREEKRPFQIEKGEMVRFLYASRTGKTELLAMMHHLAGDGHSLIILMADILRSLNGGPLALRPMQLLSRDDLPPHPGLNPIMHWMMKSVNARWRRCGKVFSTAEYDAMRRAYADEYESGLLLREIEGDQLSALQRTASDNGLTLGSLLTTAFAASMKDSPSIGIAVDIRPPDFAGMGNYATGISIQAAYDAQLPFLQNARDIHDLIYRKLAKPRDRFFLYEFMNALSPTMIDSIYFTRFGGYANKLSKSVCKMCGYVPEPQGTSISNLGQIKIESEEDWRYRYEALFFLPPYVPNVRRVIGLSTYNGRLTLSLRTPDSNIKAEQACFDAAYRALAALW